MMIVENSVSPLRRPAVVGKGIFKGGRCLLAAYRGKGASVTDDRKARIVGNPAMLGELISCDLHPALSPSLFSPRSR